MFNCSLKSNTPVLFSVSYQEIGVPALDEIMPLQTLSYSEAGKTSLLRHVTTPDPAWTWELLGSRYVYICQGNHGELGT